MSIVVPLFVIPLHLEMKGQKKRVNPTSDPVIIINLSGRCLMSAPNFFAGSAKFESGGSDKMAASDLHQTGKNPTMLSLDPSPNLNPQIRPGAPGTIPVTTTKTTTNLSEVIT